jgi:hypothetical protein
VNAGPWTLVGPVGEWAEDGSHWMRTFEHWPEGSVFWDWGMLVADANGEPVYGPWRPWEGQVGIASRFLSGDYLGGDEGEVDEGGIGVADAKRAVDLALVAMGWTLEGEAR